MPDCESGSRVGGNMIGEAQSYALSRLGDYQISHSPWARPSESYQGRSRFMKEINTEKVKREACFRVIRNDAAGIDIGSRKHYVAVGSDKVRENVRSFGCYTTDLHEMARWLKEYGIKTVAMESTGVYWIPVVEVLEQHGLETMIVDARHLSHVPGRKSDVQDCQWIQQLHSCGLLNGAFRPDDATVVLRSYWRERSSIVDSCSRAINKMQKALEQMNMQIHKAISDITGLTGMKIIRAIVSGERDALKLAGMRHPSVKSSEEEIAKSLTGNYRQEHLFALKP
jgi:transposase